MISALHLLWIIPVCIFAGVLLVALSFAATGRGD